ncbi:MAG: RluA family pseudouridine synthase [Atopobiaceae bacterium]|nr:RluA family pseudouridine synthase [Atopobiaceae bacterium]
MPDRLVGLLVGPEGDGVRIDAFLSAQDGMPSRSACARLIEEGRVTINSTSALSKSERVALGDRVSVELPEPEDEGGPLVPNPDIPLDIRYEDDRLIVLSKQAGLVCHPSPGHAQDSLANALVAHCGYDHLGLLQGEDRPGIVHRLDMDTSGLMVCAKDDEMQRALQDLIRLRVLDRRYLVLVHGYVAPETGTITTGIARSTRDRLRMAVSDDPGAREAITPSRRSSASRRGGATRATAPGVPPLTGRTHQIRVHMRHISHQVVGDRSTGGATAQNLGSTAVPPLWHIRFDHPDGRPSSLPTAARGPVACTRITSEGTSMDDGGGERICPQLGGVNETRRHHGARR